MDIIICIACEPRKRKTMQIMNTDKEIVSHKGNIPLLKTKIVAVIGRRNATETDKKNAYRIGKLFADHGVTVLNGMAYGCDQYALEGALDAGGNVIAVLPSGVSNIYPKGLIELADRIVSSGGLIVSQFEESKPANRYSFLMRDRLQVDLSSAVVVVASNASGGSVYTANYALDLKKTVLCISGNNRSLEANSRITAINCPKDILGYLEIPVGIA